METYIGIVTFAATQILADTGLLECYSCRNASNINVCNQAVTCAANQACFMEVMTQANAQKSYTMSCRDNNDCSKLSSSIHPVGRSPDGLVRRQSSFDHHYCRECCSSSLYNIGICNHTQPSVCEDDPSIDCARISSIFNVCEDIHKAKMVCPKFCNLCNIVDGNWNTWLSWTVCDVTCGNGTRSRDRACTNPAPQNGGQDCIGSSVTSETCSMAVCPTVHGSWSEWSSWGSCSVTCDIGLQRRDRGCDTPYPALGGDHCFGDSRDDRICYESAFANGGWSPWEQWSSCSVTCGDGLRTKNRACNNPAPSFIGRYCDGQPQVTDLCYNKPCLERQNVAFSVYLQQSVYKMSSNQTIKFEVVVINDGNAYNHSTGIFTVPVSGVYMLTASLESLNSHRQWFNIVADGQILSTIVYFPANDQHATGTNVVIVRLNKMQRIWVAVDPLDTGESLQGVVRTSTFSGLFLYD
ncbi:thrombospondin-2-like isoform X1 [Dreissena polymorpha]|uniref:thrombospondin-2-like isoform X1 n=1 Tax=Dreissena polymorpha TaxID=45954 RepID=UPI00226491E6|nr:thrombospondin-2-like isoform X1 [Dreissena polymorpha]